MRRRLQSKYVQRQPLGVCYEWALRKRRRDVVTALDMVLAWRHGRRTMDWLVGEFCKLPLATSEQTLQLMKRPPDLDGMTREKPTIIRR